MDNDSLSYFWSGRQFLVTTTHPVSGEELKIVCSQCTGVGVRMQIGRRDLCTKQEARILVGSPSGEAVSWLSLPSELR